MAGGGVTPDTCLAFGRRCWAFDMENRQDARPEIETHSWTLLSDKELSWPVSSKGKADFYRQISQANSGYTDEAQPLYDQISRPVLILWGREDTWIPIKKGEVLHDMIPDSLFHVISDAVHLVLEEQPDQLIKKIRPFLQNEPIT